MSLSRNNEEENPGKANGLGPIPGSGVFGTFAGDQEQIAKGFVIMDGEDRGTAGEDCPLL
jgi:hypothetical protein